MHETLSASSMLSMPSLCRSLYLNFCVIGTPGYTAQLSEAFTSLLYATLDHGRRSERGGRGKVNGLAPMFVECWVLTSRFDQSKFLDEQRPPEALSSLVAAGLEDFTVRAKRQFQSASSFCDIRVEGTTLNVQSSRIHKGSITFSGYVRTD